VKINLHEQLLLLRRREVERPESLNSAGISRRLLERWGTSVLGWVLADATRSARFGALARSLGRRFPSLLRLGPLGVWSRARDWPELPRHSFHEQYARRRAARARPQKEPSGRGQS
jgi:hypothetical protein